MKVVVQFPPRPVPLTRILIPVAGSLPSLVITPAKRTDPLDALVAVIVKRTTSESQESASQFEELGEKRKKDIAISPTTTTTATIKIVCLGHGLCSPAFIVKKCAWVGYTPTRENGLAILAGWKQWEPRPDLTD